jgi:hypothetical protein
MYGRQAYVPGGQLFARTTVRFGGVTYKRGAALPEMSRGKHRAMYIAGKAWHVAPKVLVPPKSEPVSVRTPKQRKRRSE